MPITLAASCLLQPPYSHHADIILSPFEKWLKTPPIWLQKAGINGPLLSQQKKVRFQHILHFQKHIHTPRKPESRSSSPTTQKQPPKHSFSTIAHSKNCPHPYQNENLIIFSFSCLSTTRKRGKFQPSLLLQLFGQEVKFCWYNFSLYHFIFCFTASSSF